MSASKLDSVPFTRHTLPSTAELVHLVKTFQRRGKLHLSRPRKEAQVPKSKLKICANFFSNNC
jgi:hypothetical protein